MDALQQALKIAFASEFAFYLKAHYFHWNVEGPLFPQLHKLFGKIYEEVYDSIDPLLKTFVNWVHTPQVRSLVLVYLVW